MKLRVWLGVALVIAVVTPVLLLSAQRGADEHVVVATADAQAAETKAPAKAKVTLPSGTSAEDVYTKLTAEIEAQARQASSASPDEQLRSFEAIGAKLEAFRAKYPNTPQALDATFQLGAMKSGMQDFVGAEKYLVEYLKGAKSAERDQLAYAHFYLAEAYKNNGKYDQAEGEYRLITRDYADVNPRLTSYVQTSLESLGSERLLAIGGEPIGFDVKSIRGERLSPSAYRGKVLLIDFWATWCGPCVAEMPNVKNVYSKYHTQGFEIVGISLDQSRDKLDKYITSQEIAWPQYFDGKWWNNDVAVRYGIKSIPSTFLVDKKGKIRYKSLRGHQLEKAVQELLAEKV